MPSRMAGTPSPGLLPPLTESAELEGPACLPGVGSGPIAVAAVRPGGLLVVNVGEQLSAMSNNRFKATIHRVLDIGQDRYVLITNEYMTYNDPFLSIDFPIHSFMNHVWMPTSM